MEHSNNLPRPVRDGDRFDNPWPTWKHPSIWDALKFALETDNSDVPKQLVMHFICHNLLISSIIEDFHNYVIQLILIVFRIYLFNTIRVLL